MVFPFFTGCRHCTVEYTRVCMVDIYTQYARVVMASYCLPSTVMSMSGCLSVCLSTHITRKPHSPTAVAWSSAGGVTIRYVLPVLWMTSCFLIMALWRAM